MRHNFCICESENAIICGKICDMWVLVKYAVTYAIAYSHKTNIPSYFVHALEVKSTDYCHALHRVQLWT